MMNLLYRYCKWYSEKTVRPLATYIHPNAYRELSQIEFYQQHM